MNVKQQKIRPKRMREGELRALRRKELISSLLPLAKSFALWIVGIAFVAWDYTTYRWFSMLFVRLTTYLSFGLSKMLFIPVKLLGSRTAMVTTLEVNSDLIMISGYPMKIELECSAYHAYIAIVALVVFSAWKRIDKLVYGSSIFLALAILNSLRIVMLGVIGHRFPSVFNVMHDYIWNILLVIILWGLWEFVNNRLTKEI